MPADSFFSHVQRYHSQFLMHDLLTSSQRCDRLEGSGSVVAGCRGTYCCIVQRGQPECCNAIAAVTADVIRSQYRSVESCMLCAAFCVLCAGD
jgi:hypothetical protein